MKNKMNSSLRRIFNGTARKGHELPPHLTKDGHGVF